MSVFGNYARYYDLLYRDKDYAGEVRYVCDLLQRYGAKVRRLLELGCGTGRHAELLAQQGFDVCGIDGSAVMLEQAQRRAAAARAGRGALSFRQGDIRTFELSERFDAVLSLFHVVSYLTTNADLRALFGAVKRHLAPGGVFVFDFWYGPAVLTDRPSVRVRRLEDDVIDVTRLAEPVMHPQENVVDVNYEILIREKATGRQESVRENHRMRYLFQPELDLLLSDAGLAPVAAEEWMTAKQPGFDTWGVCCVARA
jgi:SAM-dependent methyltransferase